MRTCSAVSTSTSTSTRTRSSSTSTSTSTCISISTSIRTSIRIGVGTRIGACITHRRSRARPCEALDGDACAASIAVRIARACDSRGYRAERPAVVGNAEISRGFTGRPGLRRRRRRGYADAVSSSDRPIVAWHPRRVGFVTRDQRRHCRRARRCSVEFGVAGACARHAEQRVACFIARSRDNVACFVARSREGVACFIARRRDGVACFIGASRDGACEVCDAFDRNRGFRPSGCNETGRAPCEDGCTRVRGREQRRFVLRGAAIGAAIRRRRHLHGVRIVAVSGRCGKLRAQRGGARTLPREGQRS